VMEYVEGRTLEETLKVHLGRLPWKQVIEVALQILDTLDYLHGHKPPIIYRDMKPSNIMLLPNGRVKLIDFGIARHFQPKSRATVIGTPGYASPEQYKGNADTRSDLYSLGAVIHQALTGRDPCLEPPFSFPPLQQLRPDLDPMVIKAVNSALCYNPSDRPATAAAFRELLRGKEQTATRVPVGTRPADKANIVARVNPANLRAYPASIRSPVGPQTLSCSRCGYGLSRDDAFCGNCGKRAAELAKTMLTGAANSEPAHPGRTCSNCGATEYSRAAQWCTRCGAKLSSILSRQVRIRPQHETWWLWLAALSKWPFAAAVLIILGCLTWMIPLVGWIISLLLWLRAAFYPIVRAQELKKEMLGICPICDQEFSFNSDSPPSSCPKCSTKFDKLETLFVHAG
jgi:predicted amidophosphoribosyltransferase